MYEYIHRRVKPAPNLCDRIASRTSICVRHALPCGGEAPVSESERYANKTKGNFVVTPSANDVSNWTVIISTFAVKVKPNLHFTTHHNLMQALVKLNSA